MKESNATRMLREFGISPETVKAMYANETRSAREYEMTHGIDALYRLMSIGGNVGKTRGGVPYVSYGEMDPNLGTTFENATRPKIDQMDPGEIRKWIRPSEVMVDDLIDSWWEMKERLRRIDDHAGQACEASGYVRASVRHGGREVAHNDCGPVEHCDDEGIPLCAERYDEEVEEAKRGVEVKEPEMPETHSGSTEAPAYHCRKCGNDDGPYPQKNGDGHAYKPPLGFCQNCGAPPPLHDPRPVDVYKERDHLRRALGVARNDFMEKRYAWRGDRSLCAWIDLALERIDRALEI